MIIARTPLRITLGGGGTDLPFYYKNNEGFCVSASVKYYTYVTLSKTFYNYFILKYSKSEKVKNIGNIKHSTFKEIYKHFKVKDYLEATSLADIPSGTGMGSSSSFTISLCLALNRHLNKRLNLNQIISLACSSEMKITHSNTGKQDPYGVSYPGFNAFVFHKDDSVSRKKIKVSKFFLKQIEDRFVLVYSNFSRSSKKILASQKETYLANKSTMLYYDKLKELGYQSFKALKESDIESIGYILNEQAMIKNIINKNKINSELENLRKLCLANGALGGRILGAGAGGFFLFCTKDKNKFKTFLHKKDIKSFDIEIDDKGPIIL